MDKEKLKVFYFIETIDKMYFLPDFHVRQYEILLNVDSDNPNNPRIVELFYFPFQQLGFRNLYDGLLSQGVIHYSYFQIENDGRIYEVIDKASLKRKYFDSPFAQKIISFIDKDLEKARETVYYSSIGTLVSIYEQTLKGLKNMNKAIEEGRDLHIFKKLWEAVRWPFDLKKFEESLERSIDSILSVLKELKELKDFKGIKEYTILKEIPKKLYEIKVRLLLDDKRYALYKIQIDDDTIKVSIGVEYDMRKVVEEIYKDAELVVSPFDWYREKATKSWYYFLRPTP